MGERPTPRAPHPGKRRPPRAPSCHPHSAQSQLARARVMGSVTGPNAHTPRFQSQWVAGPARMPQGRAVGRGRAPDPGRPTHRQQAPTSGALVPPPQRAQSTRKSPRCGMVTGPHTHTPGTQSQWVAGPGRTLQRRTVGRGRAPQRGCPTPRQEKAPPGLPRATPQRARSARKSARCGIGCG